MLLSNPALRQPPAPVALPESNTLNAISGFQGFQEAVPADSAGLAVPVTVESPASSPARRRASEQGPQAETSMTDDADMANMTDAAESSARADDAKGQIGVARRGRGTWDCPKQPFVAAGRHTGSSETAAQLLSSGASPTPTAVAPSSNRGATAAAEAQPQVAAGLVEMTQHEVAAAESAVATSAADSKLPHSSTNPEEATFATEIAPAATSVPQQPADAEQAQQQQAQQQQAQQQQAQQQQAQQQQAQQQHTPHQHAQQDQQQLAQQAQQVAATAEVGGQAVDKPAAGSYRRVAWAPVQNPFPAAGATSARAASAGAAEAASAGAASAGAISAGTVSAGMVASGATAAEATAAPASVPSSCVDADQVADSTQGLRLEHASDCTEQASEPAQHSAQQLERSPSQEPELTQDVAQDLEGTQGASGGQSNEAAAVAAVAVPAIGMVQQGACVVWWMHADWTHLQARMSVHIALCPLPEVTMPSSPCPPPTPPQPLPVPFHSL